MKNSLSLSDLEAWWIDHDPHLNTDAFSCCGVRGSGFGVYSYGVYGLGFIVYGVGLEG
jgi:hypothetical protein